MKLKNLIVFTFLAALGLVSVSHAGYFTTKSSAVCITTGTDMEITRITISSAQGSINDFYVVIVDTNPNEMGNVGLGNVLPRLSGDFTEIRYPVSQWRLPALTAITTNTTTTSGLSTTYSFPEGLNFEKGITLFLIEQGPGLSNPVVTVEYNKKGRR